MIRQSQSSHLFTRCIGAYISVMMLQCANPVHPTGGMEVTSLDTIITNRYLVGFVVVGSGFLPDMSAEMDGDSLGVEYISPKKIKVHIPPGIESLSSGIHVLSLRNSEGVITQNVKIIQGRDGWDGQDGSDGLSIVWRGAGDRAPAGPEVNWAYFNTQDNITYIWSGVSWDTMLVGISNEQARGVVWKGTWDASTTYNPNDAVSWNSNSYIALTSSRNKNPERYPSAWDTLVMGREGTSFTWKGTWHDTVGYQPNDAVFQQGNAYIATLPSINSNPAVARESWDTLLVGIEGEDGTSLNWRGVWFADSSYEENDVVRFEGNAYIAVKASTGKQPSTTSDRWNVLVEKGDSGASGISIVWRGEWDSTAWYAGYDAVVFYGSSYIALDSSRNKKPTNWPEYWDILAEGAQPADSGRTGYMLSTSAEYGELEVILSCFNLPNSFPSVVINDQPVDVQTSEGKALWKSVLFALPGERITYRIMTATDTLSGHFDVPPLVSAVTCNGAELENSTRSTIEVGSEYVFSWQTGDNVTHFCSYTSSGENAEPFSGKRIDATTYTIPSEMSDGDSMIFTISPARISDITQGGSSPKFTSEEFQVYHHIEGYPFHCIVHVSVSIIDDGFEPDNTGAEATPITADGIPQTHTITPEDNDWLSFSANAGNVYSIETTGETDTYLSLYKADLTTVITQNDDGGEQVNAKIEWTCDEGGEYFVMVRGYSTRTEGEYEIRVTAQ